MKSASRFLCNNRIFIFHASIRQDISGHCFLGLNLAFSGIPRKTEISTKNVTGLLDAHFYKEYKKCVKFEMIINTKK